MKRTLYYLTIIALFLASCNPMEDIENELEEMDKGYKGTFAHVLTSDDYSEIADLALEKDSGDAANADFISDYEYFTDDVPAADYIPLLIPEMFPALGKESNGLISYNYSGSQTVDLSIYTKAVELEIAEWAYTSVDEILDQAKYFSPSYPPGVYIPGILADSVETPAEGDILLVEYMYSDVDAKIDLENSSDVELWVEDFADLANGLGKFTATSVVGDNVWGRDEYSGVGYAKMSGFDGVPVQNEDWLISEAIDLAGLTEASLHITQAINYLNDQWDQIKIYISTDYNGSDIPGATWDEVTVTNMPTGDDWTFVASGAIDLSSYVGQGIYVAFKFLSSDSNAATWEVSDVTITTPGSVAIIGKAPMTYKDYYVYESSAWVKASGVYYINDVDYDGMGGPGQYSNFSDSDDPDDYIPNLLDNKFPLAGPDTEIVVVYNYYDGGTKILASTYTYNNLDWEAPMDYVTKTAQFIYGGTGWVFDPTVTYTMGSADFQLIVDWVGTNIGADMLDSYGTAEFYFGAAAYYANFDIRPGNHDITVFDSWDDAAEAALATVFLPAKFPDALTQVNGVDMYYIVEFATYSGADGSYAMKFQVTKAAPNPEFTLVEGPY